jgi:hypothetical protein
MRGIIAFTSQQIAKLTNMIDNTPFSYGCSEVQQQQQHSSPIPFSAPSSHTTETHPQAQIVRNPASAGADDEPFGALAREFGVETGLIQALARRLVAF